MTTLTAYNMDIQRFMMENEAPNKKAKDVFIEKLENAVIALGKSFEKLFPPKTKRKQIIDEILYLSSGSGICKVSAKRLAEKYECHINTVTTTVKKLKETGEVLVCGLADGKNKYVFVLKSHPNFKKILKEVFFIKNVEQNVEQIVEQKSAETLDTVSVDGGNSTSNNNNSFKDLKHAINNYIYNDIGEIEAIKESIDSEPVLPIEERAERMEQYATNEIQKRFFEFIKSMPMHQIITESAYKIALSIGSNATFKDFIIAKNVLHNINLQLHSRELSVQQSDSRFERAYSKVRERRLQTETEGVTDVTEPYEMFGQDKTTHEKVEFYDWLEIREENSMAATFKNKIFGY